CLSLSLTQHALCSFTLIQVKEVTGGLQRHLSSLLPSLSVSSYPSSSDLTSPPNDIGSYSCSTLPSEGRKGCQRAKAPWESNQNSPAVGPKMHINQCNYNPVLHDHTTHIEVPEIPYIGSAESVSFGETLANDPEVQALLKALDRAASSYCGNVGPRTSLWQGAKVPPRFTQMEQLPPASPLRAVVFSSCRSFTEQRTDSAATSPFNKKKSRC
ncbi:hypothetical protein L3Q82_011276, partial [Scortum barcoo]